MERDEFDRPDMALDESTPVTYPDGPVPTKPFAVSWFTMVAVVVALGVAFAYGRASTTPSGTADAGTGLQVVGPALGANTSKGVGASERMSADAMWYPYGGRVLLQNGGSLPTAPTTADGWVFDNRGDRNRVVEALRKLTGVTSETRDEYGQLTAVAEDGSSLWVSSDPNGSFGGYIPSRSPWDCQMSGAVAPGSSAGSGEVSAQSSPGKPEPGAVMAPDISPVRPCLPTDGPGVSKARSVAVDAFELLGLDMGAVKLTSRDDGASVNVTAEILLDGVASGMAWSAEISGKGLFSVYGFSATPRRISGYPIVDAAAAVERSNDPRFQQFGPVFLGPWDEPMVKPMARDAATTTTTVTGEDAPVSDSAVMPYPDPRSTTAPSIRDGRPLLTGYLETVTVDRAELGLSQFVLVDGSVVMLPVWVLEAADGRRWSMLALDESYIEFIAPR
jgi:hypothetical protein